MSNGRYILIRAAWDPECKVWTAESPDLEGLVTEAASLDDLDAKLPGLILDLIDENDGDEIDIPVEVVATFSKRITRAAA